MMVRHILKDGTEVKDIKGKVIKASEFRTLYEVINRIQKGQKDAEGSVETGQRL